MKRDIGTSGHIGTHVPAGGGHRDGTYRDPYRGRCPVPCPGPTVAPKGEVWASEKSTLEGVGGLVLKTDEIVTRAQAKARGLKKYFTSIPCKNGHISQRLVHGAVCSICMAKMRKVSLEKHRETRRQAEKKYKTENKAKIYETLKIYRARNPAKIREIDNRYRANHIEECRARDRAARKANPEKSRLQGIVKRARKAAASGSFGLEDVKLLAVSQKNKCPICLIKITKETWHIDHIMALSMGGSNDRKNIQLLCGPCNMSKGAKDPILFAQSRGFLL